MIFAPLSTALLLAAPFLSPVFFPLAWFAFVPLLWAIQRAETWRRAVLCGWLTGFLAHLFGFHWLVYTISVFGGFPYPLSALIFVIYAGLQAIQFAVIAFLVRRLGSGPLALYPALFWVTSEFWFPHLFPWYLASSQSSFASFIQSADALGPFGASLIIMWANAVLHEIITARQGRRRAPWLAGALLGATFLASLVYGFMRLSTVTDLMNSAPKLSVAAVQGNIPVGMKWDPKQMKANLEAHTELTRTITGAQVVMWPESAIEEWLPENLPALPAPFLDALQLKEAYFVFGARSFSGSAAGSDLKAFNTAFLADGNGRVLSRYHKQVLLAFGEYLPFAAVLSKLPALPFSDGFTPGNGPRTLDLAAGIRMAPLICYEDLMPHLSRQFVKETKANLLVNLTNDAWYGKSVAPWQHARLSQWRAIETRRSLVRVTNTGITSVINAKGKIVQTLPIFVPAVMNAQVEVLEGETLYVRFGDWFAWGVSLIAAVIVLLLWRKAAG